MNGKFDRMVPFQFCLIFGLIDIPSLVCTADSTATSICFGPIRLSCGFSFVSRIGITLHTTEREKYYFLPLSPVAPDRGKAAPIYWIC